MIMDNLIYELFGYCENPVEMACRFLVVILIFQGIFGLAGALVGANGSGTGKR